MFLRKPILILFLAFQTALSFGYDHVKNVFIANASQVTDQFGNPRSDVLYIMQTDEMKIILRKNGFSYMVEKFDGDLNELRKLSKDVHHNFAIQVSSYRLDFNFPAYTQASNMRIAAEPGHTNIHYYNTPTNEPVFTNTYNQITYQDVLPGIHFIFKNENGKFKYDIVLEKTANRSQLALEVLGADNIVYANNVLTYKTPFGDITENIPVSFIENEGKKKAIHDIYFSPDKNLIQFSFPAYTKNKKVIIDPTPALMWGTYYGGSGIDMVLNVATDNLGNVLAVGQTMSTNNIATLGSHQATYVGDFDMFLVKFNKQGVRQWATYYGGMDTDRAYAICTDNNQNIYVGGSTYSTTNIVTPGAWQTNFEGPDDAFLVKFNPSGVRQWGTYYGGELHDFIAALTTDNNGDILLTGHSRSTFNISTPGTHQPVKVGVENCIISKFSSNGNLIWGTYYGNGDIDEGWGIVVDASNNIYVAGWTESSSNIATPGTFQPVYAGNMDGFITRFTSAGQQVWGTYFGGSSIDRIWCLAIDANNNLFVAGDTESNAPIATNGAWQTIKGSYDEGFLQKFDVNGQRIWGTFIGGNSADYIYGVKTLKNSNHVIIAGYTESDVNISTPTSFQPQRTGAYDAFVMGFTNNGQRIWGTYYGGANTEECKGLAIAENNNIIIGGHTFSTSDISTGNGHQQNHGGGMFDGFVAKLCVPVIPLIAAPDSICTGDTLLLTVTNPPFSSYLWHDNSILSFHQHVPQSAGTYTYWLTTLDTNNCPGESDTFTVVVISSPAIPTITQIGNMLQSSAAAGYQWYFNGNPIPGANGQTYFPLQDGSYLVEITDTNGCKAQSEILVYVGIQEFSTGSFMLYPNPTNSLLHIYSHLNNSCEKIEIIDAIGNLVFTATFENCSLTVDVANYAQGVYHVKLFTKEQIYAIKFIR